MFDSIRHIDVDRKNSLPVSDFQERYKKTGTPVVFGDLTRRWPALNQWGVNYFEKAAGDQIVPLHSSVPTINQGRPNDPVAQMPFKDYLDLLRHDESDLRLHFYNIFRHVPELKQSYTYPRLGLSYSKGLSALFAGGNGALDPMQCAVDLADIVLAHFGGSKCVLLIPPRQAKYLYRMPHSFYALPSIDFNNPDFATYPALKKLNAYVAFLGHGDALYIPSGYWYCAYYHGIGFSLALRSTPTDFYSRMTLARNVLIRRPWDMLMYRLLGRRWTERNLRLALKRVGRMT